MKNKLVWSILALVFGRLVTNIAKRFPYPFVAAIGSSYGVSVGSVQNVIALSNGAGLLSPLFGTLSERFGKKAVMVGMLALMSGMALGAALVADYGVFVLVMFGMGVGKIIYDPTLQAYLGDAIPFSRRARIMGITELSWALSLVIAAPVAGYLLDTSSVQAVFLFIAVLMALAALLLWIYVLPDADHGHDRIRILSPLGAIRTVSSHKPALFALLYSICLTLAHEIFFINYGLWMEEAFGLVLTALGAITIVIAVGEIIGEFVVISVADRLGSKRVALGGMLVATVCFFVLPALSFSLPLAMFGIFLLFVGIEAAIVASLPLFTEIMPQSRAIMMSANMGAHSLGRLAGAALGAQLYIISGGNFSVVAIVAALLGFLAWFVMWRGLRIGESPS